METIKVAAKLRTESKKGPARRMRVEGFVPAVVYGQGKESKTITVSPVEVEAVLKSPRGRNSLVSLESDTGSEPVFIREYQHHPVSREILHVDFYRVDPEAEVNVEVTLKLTGKAHGVIMGGTLRQVYRKLPVKCKPALVPVEISFDVTKLDLEQSVAAKDLVLPEGVSIRLPANQTVYGVVDERRGAEKRGEEEAVDPKAAAKAKKK